MKTINCKVCKKEVEWHGYMHIYCAECSDKIKNARRKTYIKPYNPAYSKQYRVMMSDVFILNSLLKMRSSPKELINCAREYLKLKRLIKEMSNN